MRTNLRHSSSFVSRQISHQRRHIGDDYAPALKNDRTYLVEFPEYAREMLLGQIELRRDQPLSDLKVKHRAIIKPANHGKFANQITDDLFGSPVKADRFMVNKEALIPLGNRRQEISHEISVSAKNGE